jgi:glutathione S-transferase
MFLHHAPFCPHSRFVRLVLGEMGLEAELIEERPWERRQGLLELNPAGTVPVLIDEDFVVPGAWVIVEYLDEKHGTSQRRLLPTSPAQRIEVRRLMDWFLAKFHDEVTGYLVTEKIHKRFMASGAGGGPPEMSAIRAARSNIRYHLKYIGWLVATRNWLAGDELTFADLAAAAHLSVVVYLGDVPWNESEHAKSWYARMKSRPSFRPILAEVSGALPPSAHYANPDF